MNQSRRRGRPMRLPSDGTSMRGMHLDSAPRISWLVATTRLYSADPAVRRRAGFAEVLTGLGLKADQTRISRWESGGAHVPDKVIAGYGGALHYQPGRLLTVAAGLRRSLDPHAPDGALVFHDLPGERDGRDAMFERIQEGRHTGLDWTRLAAAVEGDTELYLPRQMWSELSHQLLRELLRCNRFSWVRRYEAARTLIRHPASQPAMAKAIGTLVTDPGAQATDPAISLLQEVADPGVTELLLRMLGNPEAAVRRGAAWAIAGKLARGHFDDDALDTLCARLPRMLLRRDPPSLRSDAVDMIAALPPDRSEALLAGLTGNGPLTELRMQLQWGEMVAPDRSRRLSGSLAQDTENALIADQQVEFDEMLARLVREALMHVHRERRHHASLLLAVSPYATALAERLIDSMAGQEPVVIARGLTLLTYLGVPESHRGQLLTWSAHHPNLWLRARAIVALAYLEAPLAPAEQHQLANVVLSGPPRLRGAALYTLGFTDSPELERIAATGARREREVATWWIESGIPADDEGPVAAPPPG